MVCAPIPCSALKGLYTFPGVSAVYFLHMVPAEPFFHFLKQLDFFRVARGIQKPRDGAAVIEFFVLKAACKFWQFIMGNHPAVFRYFFYFELFHTRGSAINCTGSLHRRLNLECLKALKFMQR